MNVSSPCSSKARQPLTGHSNWGDSLLEVLDDGSRQGDRILFTKLGPELDKDQSLKHSLPVTWAQAMLQQPLHSRRNPGKWARSPF